MPHLLVVVIVSDYDSFEICEIYLMYKERHGT